ncbi:Formin-like protein 2 [Homalodisca vitripennis]|nr:Formin-like protein 2 [Homalodisca vitripennis]
MDLPPDKAKVLKQYDDEKKWDIICDQNANSEVPAELQLAHILAQISVCLAGLAPQSKVRPTVGWISTGLLQAGTRLIGDGKSSSPLSCTPLCSTGSLRRVSGGPQRLLREFSQNRSDDLLIYWWICLRPIQNQYM